MASYFVKYNDVDLTDMIRVRTVNTTVLPPRENNAITIWERPGSIYNSYRYGEREITVTFLIRASRDEFFMNPYIMDSKLDTLRNVFDVPEPKPLFLGSVSRFIYAVPEGEFKMTELRYDCYECEVHFVCHDPAYYSSGIQGFDGIGSSSIPVNNSGNTMAYPYINIGVNTDNVAFVQVENLTNGNKMLLGDFPTASKPVSNIYQVLLNDSMGDETLWEANATDIDEDRYGNNPLITTSDKDGLTLTNEDEINNDGSIWKGAAGKRVLPREVKDFIVEAKMLFTSSGTDGDPSVPNLDNGMVSDGYKKVIYYINGVAVNVREAPSLDAKIIAVLRLGNVCEAEEEPTNGWVHIIHEDIDGYVMEHCLNKTYYDSTTDMYGTVISQSTMSIKAAESYTIKNVVTKTKVELRSAPTTDTSKSTILATIPAGTAIRINDTNENGFYKLYIAYNGKIGYVNASQVEEREGAAVIYSQDEIKKSADDQTGVCELYGWAANGTKLFKLSLIDDNEYYEYTKPAIQVGSNVILQDNTSVPKQATTSGEKLTITDDALANGALGDWNDFYGELGIQRIDNKWKAWIYKMKDGTAVKRLEFKEQAVNESSTEKLAYITIFMGVLDVNARSSMAITNIKVTSLDNRNDSESTTPARFMKGDEIKIDCYNNKVYLNDKLYNGIDISSGFIGLVSGSNSVKVTSDDPELFTTVLFNERHI